MPALTNNWLLVRVTVTLRLSVYCQSVRLGAKPLDTYDQYFIQLNPCGHSPYVSFPLTGGRVCRLQLLLVFASAVILGSKSSGTHDLILLSQIRDSVNLEGQAPLCIFPGNRVAQLLQIVLLLTSLHGPHRKHRSSIVALVSVAAETSLPTRCLETRCITPFFYCCLRVFCRRYLATAAQQQVHTPQYLWKQSAQRNLWFRKHAVSEQFRILRNEELCK
jgi:hypothetical protein